MPGAIDYAALQIVPDPDTREWWAATKEHRYLVRQCNACGHKWFPAFPACARCGSMDVGWFETAGKGEIHSYIVVEQPILAAFRQAVPYVVALIELPDTRGEDGSVVRMGGVLLDDEAAVAIGLPVEVVYEETPNPEIVMPRWKISGTTEDSWKFVD